MSGKKLTNSVDFIRELPGTEGSRVGGDALVEQVDDVAVPASLHRRHSGIMGPASIPKPPSSSKSASFINVQRSGDKAEE